MPLAVPQVVQTSVLDRRKQVGRNMFHVHRRTVFPEKHEALRYQILGRHSVADIRLGDTQKPGFVGHIQMFEIALRDREL